MDNNDVVHFVLRIPKADMEAARACANADSRSINTFLCIAAKEAIRRAQHNIEVREGVKLVQAEPGIDIIQQRRDGKGKFTKRNESTMPPAPAQQ